MQHRAPRKSPEQLEALLRPGALAQWQACSDSHRTGLKALRCQQVLRNLPGPHTAGAMSVFTTRSLLAALGMQKHSGSAAAAINWVLKVWSSG